MIEKNLSERGSEVGVPALAVCLGVQRYLRSDEVVRQNDLALVALADQCGEPLRTDVVRAKECSLAEFAVGSRELPGLTGVPNLLSDGIEPYADSAVQNAPHVIQVGVVVHVADHHAREVDSFVGENLDLFESHGAVRRVSRQCQSGRDSRAGRSAKPLFVVVGDGVLAGGLFAEDSGADSGSRNPVLRVRDESSSELVDTGIDNLLWPELETVRCSACDDVEAGFFGDLPQQSYVVAVGIAAGVSVGTQVYNCAESQRWKA